MNDIISRSYLSWPGNNKFICEGKIMVGYALFSPDVHRAIITFFLILVPGIIFLCVPGNYFAEDYIFVPILSAIFLVLSLTFQIITSTTNPGFLPRQEPPFAIGPRGAPTISFAMQQDPTKLAAIDKGFFEYQVGGRLIKMKYCKTCKYYLGLILRPPRSSHCGDCDVCVEKFDHHCPWVGNCIGKRNYKFFMGFLYSTSSLIIFNLVFSIYHLVVVSVKAKDDGGIEALQKALQHAGPTMFILLVAVVMMWFVLGLTFFHTYLLFTGQTTNEIIKKSWKNSYNPYTKRSIPKNIFSVICAKTFPMRFNATAWSSLNFQKYFICPSVEATTKISEKFSEYDGKPEKYCDNNKTGGLVSPCDGITNNEPSSARFKFHDDKILINFN